MAIYRLGFVMEQTLGHVTHYLNLRHWVSQDGSVVPEWILINYNEDDLWGRVPVIRSNWTLLAGLRARARIKAALRRQKLDGLFFHTQVTAVCCMDYLRRVPSIVSMDATPKNMDSVGEAYGHKVGGFGPMEAIKFRLNRLVFQRARHLTTWNYWAKNSLVEDYGIDREKVTVVPPGIDLGKWSFERYTKPPGSRVRLLFVGGDFERKGGPMVLEVMRTRLRGKCELDIVTRDPVDLNGLEGVRVHHNMKANSPELMNLYQHADIFVLPTLGECYSVAGIEATAAGLPVITSRIGGVPEIVLNGETGYKIEPGDIQSLGDHLERLVADEGLRLQMGWAARRVAETKFNGAITYGRLLEMLKRCADGKL
jgi:glycosyltransferase involved in cell wall biosynthesis